MKSLPTRHRPDAAPFRRDDRLLAPTRWVAAAIVPVLVAAFVLLYLFPDRTRQLWSWTVEPSMSALIMGGGYLSGAYFFARTARSGEWHRVGVGFVATTVFSSVLLATTVLHWDRFNYAHVSFWAWIVLYGSTPFLLPILWRNNQRTDPKTLLPPDAVIPRSLRLAVGVGGLAQLAVAVLLFGWPGSIAPHWPWHLNAATARSLSAFVAFPAVTWAWFLVEDRWSSFRITQQTATIGLTLLFLAALRARADFLSNAWFCTYLLSLLVAFGLNVALYVVMERRVVRRERDSAVSEAM